MPGSGNSREPSRHPGRGENMELWECMDKDEWMNLWDTLEAERREQARLTEKYQHR
jgi:hypothetical protein